MLPTLGITEILMGCFVGLIGIGLPIAVLVLLYMIYNKIKNIEEILRKE